LTHFYISTINFAVVHEAFACDGSQKNAFIAKTTRMHV